ncbi:MAG: SAM-dependent methyltransferase [Armatimonadota bacterium]|nr:SAM-dependent methyltransferase [Armatimonadota bacterium]
MKDDTPSGTALLIARSLVFFAPDPLIGPLVPARAVEASLAFLNACGGNAARFQRLSGRAWFRALVAWAERQTIPGILSHFILRKRFLEDCVRRALEDDFAQVVVLGAGFDTLALRLHYECPAAAFLEVDHPATQRAKRRALAARAPLAANLSLVPLDFAQAGLETLLSCAAYHPQARTLFVAEGLLMYLDSRQVNAVLAFMRDHSGPESRLAFTFMEPQKNGRVNFDHPSKAVDLWLRLRRERFQWGMSRDKIAPFMEAQGFRVQELVTAEQLRQQYLPAAAASAHVNGDLICLAERR